MMATTMKNKAATIMTSATTMKCKDKEDYQQKLLVEGRG